MSETKSNGELRQKLECVADNNNDFQLIISEFKNKEIDDQKKILESTQKLNQAESELKKQLNQTQDYEKQLQKLPELIKARENTISEMTNQNGILNLELTDLRNDLEETA